MAQLIVVMILMKVIVIKMLLFQFHSEIATNVQQLNTSDQKMSLLLIVAKPKAGLYFFSLKLAGIHACLSG